jgi:hypothetical protein
MSLPNFSRFLVGMIMVLITQLGLQIPHADAAVVVQGTSMQSAGEFLLPVNGYLWSSSGDYVDVYDASENLFGQVYLNGHSSLGLCATPDGAYVYITASDAGVVYQIDTSSLEILNSYENESIRQFGRCASDGVSVIFTAWSEDEVLAFPLDLSSYNYGTCGECWGITYSSESETYLAVSSSGGYIRIYDASTILQTEWWCSECSFDTVRTVSTYGYKPYDIIFAAGYIWVADYAGKIEKYSTSIEPLNSFSVSGSPWLLTAAMDSIWVTLRDTTVAALDVTSGALNYFDVGGSESSGIANLLGEVYVGDPSRNIARIFANNQLRAPGGLSATRTNGSIVARWNPLAGSSRYQLELRSGGNLLRSVSLTQSSYSFSAVLNGTPYTIRVAGVNGSGTGIYASIIANAVGAPSASVVTGVRLGASSVQVSFHTGATNGSAVTSSRVTLQPSGKVCFVNSSAYNQSCQIAGLVPGARYRAQVTSSNAFGSSPLSSSYSFTAIGIPSAPQGLAVRAALRSALVSFKAPLSAGGSPITLYQYSINGGRTWLNSLYNKGLSFPITGLRSGLTYTIGVRAFNAAGPGLPSKFVPVKVK